MLLMQWLKEDKAKSWKGLKYMFFYRNIRVVLRLHARPEGESGIWNECFGSSSPVDVTRYCLETDRILVQLGTVPSAAWAPKRGLLWES